MGISNEGQEQSYKFQFIEQFPAVILRNEETKNLDLNTLNKRLKSEILHRLRRGTGLRNVNHFPFQDVLVGVHALVHVGIGGKDAPDQVLLPNFYL